MSDQQMERIKIQINDYTYDIPASWDQVTLEQYIDLDLYRDELSPIRLLSILTRLNYDVLSNLPCDEFILKVMPKLEWIGENYDVFSAKRKREIQIGNYLFDTIIDVGKERLGQKLYMQQLVNNAMKNNLNHCLLIAPVVANYYAPFVHPDKKWNEQHIKDFEKMVMKMPMVDAYAEANFFLSGYIVFQKKNQLH